MSSSPTSRPPSWLIALAGGIAVGAVAVYVLTRDESPDTGPPAAEKAPATPTPASGPKTAPASPQPAPGATDATSPPDATTPAPGGAAPNRDCDVCPELVEVPAGQFMMGAAGSDKEAGAEERPQHRVKLGKSLLVGKYEVTFAGWDACRADGGCTHNPDDFGWGRDRRPVVHVSWGDTQQYLQWLRSKTGKAYRLLTEAEWEYVARAGTSTVYPWGDRVGSGNANCRVCGSQWDNRQTAPAGSFSPNGFGLYDTSGNVWEWVEDCWSDDHQGASGDGAAAAAGDSCERRVLRGGSWTNKAGNLRCSARAWGDPGGRVNILGFRVAREK